MFRFRGRQPTPREPSFSWSAPACTDPDALPGRGIDVSESPTDSMNDIRGTANRYANRARSVAEAEADAALLTRPAWSLRWIDV